MSDITLLQVMKTKENLELYKPLLKDHLISDEAKMFIRDYEAYFEQFKDHDKLDLEMFNTWFYQFRHPNINTDKKELTDIILSKLAEEPNNSTIEGLKDKLHELHYATVIANKAKDYSDGRITGDRLITSVQDETDKLMDKKSNSGDVPWDNAPLSNVIQNLSYDAGLKFRLKCLDACLGSLHASKFGIIGAYVDTGKSTFLSDLASYFAEQANNVEDKWYSGRPIMWFNNEGASGEIRLYCVQSSINGSRDQIYARTEEAEARYSDKTGELIKVIPCQGWHIKEVEREIKKYKPCVVIYDMLDNVGGFENEGTVDIRYRQLYDYVRQLADNYQHLALATSQCTGEANGLEQIEMHMLTGSRVAKQSTADFIITIGRSLDRGKENHRFLYAPKNKLTPKEIKADRKINSEVRFDGMRKRFLDPVEVKE